MAQDKEIAFHAVYGQLCRAQADRGGKLTREVLVGLAHQALEAVEAADIAIAEREQAKKTAAAVAAVEASDSARKK